MSDDEATPEEGETLPVRSDSERVTPSAETSDRYEVERLPERVRESYRRMTAEDPSDVYSGRAELDLVRAILHTHLEEWDENLRALQDYYAHWEEWKEDDPEARRKIKPPVLELTPPADLVRLFESVDRIRAALRKEHNENSIPQNVWHALVHEMNKAVEGAMLSAGFPVAEVESIKQAYVAQWRTIFDRHDVS